MVWPSGKQGTFAALLQETRRTNTPGGEWEKRAIFPGHGERKLHYFGNQLSLISLVLPKL